MCVHFLINWLEGQIYGIIWFVTISFDTGLRKKIDWILSYIAIKEIAKRAKNT